MRSVNEHQDSIGGDIYRELRVLEEVNATPDLSQRRLAARLAIALGVANLLLRDMAGRGYVRVTQLGWRRWAYIITPAGIARKLQLTVAYVEQFIGHYKRVRLLLREDLKGHITEESSVAIVGSTEMAELAFLALRDIGVEEIEIFDRSDSNEKFLGMKVRKISEMDVTRYTRVLLAVRTEHDECRKDLVLHGVAETQILEILGRRKHTSPNGANGAARGVNGEIA